MTYSLTGKMALKETVQSHQIGNIPYTSSMIPVFIPEHAFIKRKVFLAQDAGDDHGRVPVN